MQSPAQRESVAQCKPRPRTPAPLSDTKPSTKAVVPRNVGKTEPIVLVRPQRPVHHYRTASVGWALQAQDENSRGSMPSRSINHRDNGVMTRPATSNSHQTVEPCRSVTPPSPTMEHPGSAQEPSALPQMQYEKQPVAEPLGKTNYGGHGIGWDGKSKESELEEA
ncbi:hypothetical protein K458DRAFT_490190 [Lentithecium fluviatile CBS 122367]|uniref:Uncharacterized protein n=1 Tax=Lentithecium fluviatile CBS 122367 TaxID=1168545 RepID=A0A6G1IPY9_9PLEO|nr:hypothetical protein K458DRAFT_490190 [Lentithecium fluviatile CBS 122367]